jgi:hypothetical protein
MVPLQVLQAFPGCAQQLGELTAIEFVVAPAGPLMRLG